MLLIASVGLTVDYWAYPYGAPMPGRSGNVGENGLWLRYTWYFGQDTPANAHELADKLTNNQVRYAYFHVRSVLRDGSLKYREPGCAVLTANRHRTVPNVKLIAWVYVGNARGMGGVDLSNANVRRKMVSEAFWLVNDCGFDGVQWDYEICSSGDRGFIDLLEETRAALPPGKIVSVCTAIWMPHGFYGWSDGYFAEVARHCDQMTVMAYDTAAYFPRAYVELMHNEVVHVSTAVARSNPKCRVLFGVPTYRDGTKSHNPRAEDIAFGLRGVREGIADPNSRSNVIAGVAIFADYTTTAGDWREYRRDWLGR
jgi:hypothetical protein